MEKNIAHMRSVYSIQPIIVSNKTEIQVVNPIFDQSSDLTYVNLAIIQRHNSTIISIKLN